jgi:hypothetical protein
MSDDRETLIQQLLDEQGDYRVSELQRVHTFHELLQRTKPTFYRSLREAMLGKRQEKEEPHDGVRTSTSFELGVTLTRELALPESTERYVGCAFALCVEGKDLKGNASLEKHRGGDLQWRLVTNETWPTRVEHFIKRGRPLGGEVHIKELQSLARQAEVTIPEGVLEDLFRSIDSRLSRLYRVLRSK